MEKISQYAVEKLFLGNEDLFDVSNWDGAAYDESQKLKWSTLRAAVDNLYNMDGSLSGVRTVDQNGNDLSFFGSGAFSIGTITPAGTAKFHVSTLGDPDALVIRDSDGNVGVGVSSPQARFHSYNGGLLVPYGSSTVGLFQNNALVGDDAIVSVIAGLNGKSRLTLGAIGNQFAGAVSYDHLDQHLEFTANSNTTTYLKANGYFGLGTDDPQARLHVLMSGTAGTPSIDVITGLVVQNDDDDEVAMSLIGLSGTYGHINFGDDSDEFLGRISYDLGINKFEFYNNQTLKMDLNSSGRLNVYGGNGNNVNTGTGSTNSPAYSFQADTNTGMYRIAADTFGFSTGGNERIRIDPDGLVGIGTTPTALLDVLRTQDGTTSVTVSNLDAAGTVSSAAFSTKADTAQVFLIANGMARNAVRYGIVVGGWSEILANAGNGLIIGTTGNVPVVIGTDNAERMRINATGVGIGGSAPNWPLHVKPGFITTWSTITSSGTAGGAGSAGILLGNATSEVPSRIVHNNTNSSLSLWTANFERLTVDAIGRVGIGTTTPAASRLHTANTALPPQPAWNNGDTVIFSRDGDQFINIHGTTTDLQALYFSDSVRGSGQIRYYQSTNQMAIHTSGVERVRIDNSGRVGINEAVPDKMLHITDADLIARFESTGNGDAAITIDIHGLELISAGMNNSSARIGMGIKFMSTDDAFTTTNPKLLAGIFPEATETYSVDTSSGMGIGFYVTPDNAGVSSLPTRRMFLSQNGRLGIGANFIDPQAPLHITGSLAIAPPAISASTMLTIQNTPNTNGAAYMSIIGGTTGQSAVFFGDSASENAAGQILYTHSDDRLYVRAGSFGEILVRSDGNIGINKASAFGASAAGVLGIKNGTAPTTSPADTTQIWSADTAAGDANLYARREGATAGAAGNEQITGLTKSSPSNLAKSSDTAPVLMTGLSINVESGKTYSFIAYVPYTLTGSGGAQAGIGGTFTATNIIYTIEYGLNANSSQLAGILTVKGGFAGSPVNNVNGLVMIRGTVTVNAGGTFEVRIAQNAATGTTTFRQGAFLKLFPVS